MKRGGSPSQSFPSGDEPESGSSNDLVWECLSQSVGLMGGIGGLSHLESVPLQRDCESGWEPPALAVACSRVHVVVVLC